MSSNPNDDGVEVLCPAVYVTDSATEALEVVAQEANHFSNAAYDTYGDGRNLSSQEFIDYLLELGEDE